MSPALCGEGKEQPLLWDGEGKGAEAVLGVIVKENQHHPVADGKWEHHLTAARARHSGNVSYRQSCMTGQLIGLVFLAEKLLERLALHFPVIFHNFPTCCVLSLGAVITQTGIPWELRAR